MEAKMMLWLLVATCFWWNSKSRNHVPTFMRNVVNETSAYINGPNWNCLTVKDGDYRDGNAIIVWYCKANGDVDQIWTFESDGTVRSNGSCLTTNGYAQGSNIMIHNCDTAPEEATIWKMGENGAIVNPKSGLALTAVSGQADTEVTLEAYIYSPYQTWHFGDFKETLGIWQIHGLNRTYCLQVSNRTVLMARCESGIQEQCWFNGPDGTIRPVESTKLCLSYNDLTERRVVVLPCGLGPSSQRWVLTGNGTILNERANLVMEIRDFDLNEIVVSPPTELPNQKWEMLPSQDKKI